MASQFLLTPATPTHRGYETGSAAHDDPHTDGDVSVNTARLANALIACLALYVAGESFAIGNRKGGWLCLVCFAANVACLVCFWPN